jgi:hypothetical protein
LGSGPNGGFESGRESGMLGWREEGYRRGDMLARKREERDVKRRADEELIIT